MPARRVPVHLHALAADLAGATSAEIEIGPDATAADVKRALIEGLPGLARLVPVSVVATESEYLRDAATVGAATSLHLLPPVSGG